MLSRMSKPKDYKRQLREEYLPALRELLPHSRGRAHQRP